MAQSSLAKVGSSSNWTTTEFAGFPDYYYGVGSIGSNLVIARFVDVRGLFIWNSSSEFYWRHYLGTANQNL